jgi:hypothetical protein
VKPNQDWSNGLPTACQELAGATICCAVVGYGSTRATADQLPSLRQNPGTYPARPIPPGFLKHADEQTVVVMAALLQAIERHGLADACFTDWGVLAAPRYLGRITTVQALQRFRAEGAWGISPHLIPHRTLHAISGTISQALQIHGPNLGVGGGPEAALEVMRAAAAFMAKQDLPGLWIAMSGWDSEPILPHASDPKDVVPSTNGHHPVSYCQAVALALTPVPRVWDGLRLDFHFTAPGSNGHTPGPAPPLFVLESFLAALEGVSQTKSYERGKSWSLSNGSYVDLRFVGVGAEIKR